MSIKKVYLFSIVLVLFLINYNTLFAQNEPIENIQILQQPIFSEADSNLVFEYSDGWLEGYDVYYKCLLNKLDTLELNSVRLFIISDGDTLIDNNYSMLNSNPGLQIIDNGKSAVFSIDTLLYSSDYLFSLQIYDIDDILLQEINYSETSN